jgi:hypothetical protein
MRATIERANAVRIGTVQELHSVLAPIAKRARKAKDVSKRLRASTA